MNINYYNPYVYSELYHYGIAGQHWGKRNGPPYPLGSSSMSSSEKKGKYSEGYDKPKKRSKTTSNVAMYKPPKINNDSVMKKRVGSISPKTKAKGKAIAKKMAGVALYGTGAYLAFVNGTEAYADKDPKAIAKTGVGYGLMIAGGGMLRGKKKKKVKRDEH